MGRIGDRMNVNTGVFIVNYNMFERADALAIQLMANSPTAEVILIDNGSDLARRAALTTFPLAENIQTTRGWLEGLDVTKQIRMLDSIPPLDYYAFVITSAEIPIGTKDFILPITRFMDDNPNVVGVHPALTKDSTTAWEHLKFRDTGTFRKTWMIDNIFSIYRADWFDSIGGFDKNLIYAWGIDLETCYLARQQGKELYVYQGECIIKKTDIGYNMDRMNMSAPERSKKAADNMNDILGKKYGENWFHKLTQEFVTEDLR